MKANIIDGLLTLAVPVESLEFDDINARIHPQSNLDAIAESLRRFGQRKPVVVSKHGNRIIAGNGLVEAARDVLDWTHVAAVFVDEDKSSSTAYALADNRTAELSFFDGEQLQDLLAELETEDPALIIGWTFADIDELLGRAPREGSRENATESEPKEPREPKESKESREPKDDEARVAVIQLFIPEENRETFLDDVRSLAVSLGTESVSDTVVALVSKAAVSLRAERGV